MISKCPTCGNCQSVPDTAAENLVSCARCGAEFAPMENEVNGNMVANDTLAEAKAAAATLGRIEALLQAANQKLNAIKITVCMSGGILLLYFITVILNLFFVIK